MVLDCQPVSALKRHPIQAAIAIVNDATRTFLDVILPSSVVESFAKHQLLC